MDIGKNLLEGICRVLAVQPDGYGKKSKNGLVACLTISRACLESIPHPRVFRDEIGKQLVAGIAAGIELNGDLVTEALEDLNSDMLDRSGFTMPNGNGSMRSAHWRRGRGAGGVF